MPHWSCPLSIQQFSLLYNSPINPSDKLCTAPYLSSTWKTLWYFSFSLGPCGQILVFNLPPFISCLSTVIILLGFLQHFPNRQFICHKCSEHNMTGIHTDDYYLPILQGSMSGYVARMLQCFFSALQNHCSFQTDNIFHLFLYFTVLPCYFTSCIFPNRIFFKLLVIYF